MSQTILPNEEGLRFNQGKLRFDLVHPIAHEGLVRILTKGAEKYAPKNWEKGMAWSKVIASLKRHLNAIEKGEDFDPETGELHADHLQCNAHFLSAYYKIAPQFDDRAHFTQKRFRCGVDIDEVLCDWAGTWAKKYGHDQPKNWSFSYKTKERLLGFTPEELNEFYLNLPPKIDPSELGFEPACYITSRSVPEEITKAWLEKNGFPTAPVYTVGFGKSKVEAAKEAKIDFFVDDNYDHYVELNRNGICTFLWDAPHNQKYTNVGYRRIKSFKEILV